MNYIKAFLLLLLVSSCQITETIKINPDGSGSIEVFQLRDENSYMQLGRPLSGSEKFTDTLFVFQVVKHFLDLIQFVFRRIGITQSLHHELRRTSAEQRVHHFTNELLLRAFTAHVGVVDMGFAAVVSFHQALLEHDLH